MGLFSKGILSNWIKNYEENCYNIIEKIRWRKKAMMKKINKNDEIELTLERVGKKEQPLLINV